MILKASKIYWQIFLIITVILTAMDARAERLSLEQALLEAYQNNPSLESDRAALRALDENAYQAFSGWLPTVGADFSYGWKSDKQKGSVSKDGNTQTREIGVTQPIFEGGKTIIGMQKADAEIIAAQARLHEQTQEILYQVVAAYMDVVHGKEVTSLAKNNEEVLKEHLDVTKERFRLGSVTRTDVAQAEARLARAVSERIDSEGKMQIAEARFERLVGIKGATLFSPEKKPEIPANKEQALIDMALAQHPALKAASADEEAAKQAVNAEKADLLPKVSVSAAQGYSESSVVFLNGKQEVDSSNLKLNVSIPLYRAGTEYSAIRKRNEERVKAKLESQSARRDVTEKVVQAFREWTVSRASIASNEASVNAAKIAMDGVKKEAEVGARTTLDVLDAEQELFQSRVALAAAKRQEIVSGYALLASVGNLTLPGLGISAKTYNPATHNEEVRRKIIGF